MRAGFSYQISRSVRVISFLTYAMRGDYLLLGLGVNE